MPAFTTNNGRHMDAITEKEVVGLIPPEESFVHQYVAYAAQRTDAPLIYHVGCAFTLVAAAAPGTLCIDALPGGTVYSNLWVMLSGRPALDRKSTAIRLASNLLTDALPQALGDGFDGSWEGMAESLMQKPQQVVFLEDMGDFFAMCTGDSYSAKVKNKLLRLFDCDPITRALAKRKVRVVAPRLSVVGGVNPALIERYAEAHDWEGGLMSRWLTFYAHRERDMDFGQMDGERYTWLREWMNIDARSPAGRCVGLTAAAWKRWKDWNRELASRLGDATNLARQAAHGRTQTHAVKLCLLQSFDHGPARFEPTWEVDVDTLDRSIGLAELHYRSAFQIAALAHASRDMRERKAVLNAIGRDWTSYGDVLRRSELLKARGDMLIETLQEEGAIIQRVYNGRMQYRLAPAAYNGENAALFEGHPEASSLLRLVHDEESTG